ncbi:MAG: 50S ribosomal protein L29 [Marinilabiliales bacterium]|nr:50S ribosomal protein L29 [Marinilabiliales bacterium]
MKTQEIKELTTAELTEKLEIGKEELVRMKLNHSVNPLDNPMKIRFSRKNIARLKTELRNRQIEKK